MKYRLFKNLVYEVDNHQLCLRINNKLINVLDYSIENYFIITTKTLIIHEKIISTIMIEISNIIVENDP